MTGTRRWLVHVLLIGACLLAPGAYAFAQTAEPLPEFIPAPTDADREAAFPDVTMSHMHGRSWNSMVLFDQVEWRTGEKGQEAAIDARGWLGYDRDRLWFRAHGDGADGRVSSARADLLYGRQFSRWWDALVGIRQDLRPGPAQTWAVVGVQGLAPYWFQVGASAAVGTSGQVHAQFEVEYELLVTNRLIVRPLIAADLYTRADPARGVGAGLSSTDVGVRMRYEWRREFAPYVGVTWERRRGTTTGLAGDDGATVSGGRVVTGLRMWF